MGGFGSGRWDGSPVAEDALRLDLAQLITRGFAQPGRRSRGTLTWKLLRDAQLTAVVTYAADLTDPDDAWIELRQAVRPDGDVRLQNQMLRLTTTRPHHGGQRWWFVCPILGGRARVLYWPPATSGFASQSAYHLAYRSQRQTRGDRIADKAQAARHKLGVDAVDLLEMPDSPKPKGMHWRTYHRLRGDIEALRQVLWATAPVQESGSPWGGGHNICPNIAASGGERPKAFPPGHFLDHASCDQGGEQPGGCLRREIQLAGQPGGGEHGGRQHCGERFWQAGAAIAADGEPAGAHRFRRQGQEPYPYRPRAGRRSAVALPWPSIARRPRSPAARGPGDRVIAAGQQQGGDRDCLHRIGLIDNAGLHPADNGAGTNRFYLGLFTFLIMPPAKLTGAVMHPHVGLSNLHYTLFWKPDRFPGRLRSWVGGRSAVQSPAA